MKNNIILQIRNSIEPNAILIIVALATFLTTWMASSINIALPSIAKEFNITPVLLGWINTVFLLAQMSLYIPFGRIADIYGRKKIFVIGLILYTVSSLILALSNSFNMLIVFRILQGIGGATIHGIGMAIVTSKFPIGRRGRALGILSLAVFLGFSCGPVLGGLLTDQFGWRSIFWINVFMGFLTVIFSVLKLEVNLSTNNEKFDLAGSFVYSLMIVTVMFGIMTLPGISSLWLIIIGGTCFFIFIKIQLKTSSPLLNIKYFIRNNAFIIANLLTFINTISTSTVAFLLSLYLQDINGLNPKIAGVILVATPFTQSLLAPITGKYSDKFNPRIVTSIGMAVSTIGLLLFIFMGEHTDLKLIIAGLILLGCGLAFFGPPNTNEVMSSVVKESYGIASAFLSTMRIGGMVLSMAIVMVILSIYLGQTNLTPQNYPEFMKVINISFMVFTIFCSVGTVISCISLVTMRKKGSL
jgi:EmrB/QacA subfamily drug resistance transporter